MEHRNNCFHRYRIEGGIYEDSDDTSYVYGNIVVGNESELWARSAKKVNMNERDLGE